MSLNTTNTVQIENFTNRELQITSMTQGNNVTKMCSKNKTRGINAYAYGVLYYF